MCRFGAVLLEALDGTPMGFTCYCIKYSTFWGPRSPRRCTPFSHTPVYMYCISNYRHSHTLLYICIASVIINTDLIQRTQGGVWVAWPPAAQNLKLTGLTHNIYFQLTQKFD
jgi:hypothetical protein